MTKSWLRKRCKAFQFVVHDQHNAKNRISVVTKDMMRTRCVELPSDAGTRLIFRRKAKMPRPANIEAAEPVAG